MKTACPLCHTEAPGVSAADLGSGSGWRCVTCHQWWDATRLATVAAYASYVAERERVSGSAS
jgi:hypothetical protein